jgi:Fe-S cluster assembly protein SufD
VRPTGSPAERFTSLDPAEFPLPTGREEQWRFTPLRLVRDLFEPFTATGSLDGSVSAPPGVTAGPVPISDPAVGRALWPADRVAALAHASAVRAFVVTVPAGAVLEEPVFVSGQATGTSHAHLVLDFGAFAEAVVIIDYTGTGTVAENVEIVVGDGAQVSVVSIQDWEPESVHLSAHHVLVGRDAAIKHTVVNLGGSLVRVAPVFRFAGPGGSVQAYGVGFAGTGQHLETRLYVDHAMPDCTSSVVYRNALQGKQARTVWVGDVRIRPQATGTETFELNRNLLLSDGARADSIPNLEIETGDIAGAGHASATGRFDDEQMFYLQSRGIPAEQAQRLVVQGFFADILDRIGVPELQHRITTAIQARLGLEPVGSTAK